MHYTSLAQCVADLEKNKQLIRISDEVDPYLEMAAIHLRVYENGGPAILFENIKGCNYQAVSNLFGSDARCHFLFRNTLPRVQKLIALKNNPAGILKKPLSAFNMLPAAYTALPKKVSFSAAGFEEIPLAALPHIHCWKQDGGAFITLPQVYTEDPDQAGIMQANMGMYRIQLSGNEYASNELGLHYQLHRGIGVHQQKAVKNGAPLKVSIFIGGPPAHTVAAVMPLPEGMSEVVFAGMLGGRRFRYAVSPEGYTISCDADFVITGEVHPDNLKPEGPFGDHLGYYSLKHLFPVLSVCKVYAKKNAIWPFTVVGRPPQEDTGFGNLIHNMAGQAIRHEIPGVKEVHAVDAAGVHPLLLAIGSERYTPYLKDRKPSEVLTLANRILGTGQLSLAKYLFIAAQQDNTSLTTHDIPQFFQHILERVVWQRDLHFYTQTSIDTLDYSSGTLNEGSKLVVAAVGEKIRQPANNPEAIPKLPDTFTVVRMAMPGVVIVSGTPYLNKTQGEESVQQLLHALPAELQQKYPLFVLCDDADFTAASINNFVWVCFTRSNPAADIHGVDSFYIEKHWGCKGPLVIDARTKPHHAPIVEKDAETEKDIERLFRPGASLHGL